MPPTARGTRRRRPRAVGAVLAMAASVAVASAAPAVTAEAASPCKPALAGTSTRTAPGSGKTVALTFDDSRPEYMPQVLSVLRRYNVRATFFNVGKYDTGMPSVLKAAVADGHLVEDHTWDHSYPGSANGYWSVPYLTDQIRRTAAQNHADTGQPVCFFRPPGGHMNNVLAATRATGMQAVLWSVDTQDWSQPPYLSAAAQNAIVAKGTDLRYANPNHPIVLMHAGKASPEPESKVTSFRGNTVAALPRIIQWYQARGYRFVAMDGTSGLNPPPVVYNRAPSGVGLTSDARPDMLGITTSGDLRLYTGNGRGYVSGPTKIGAGWNIFNGLYATDWSGDRNRDVLARTATGDLRLYRGTGYGTVDGNWVKIGTGWNVYDTILTPGDVTGDGHPDLIGRTPSGQLNLYSGNGASGFGPVHPLAAGFQGYTKLLTSGDFNRDLKPDLIGRTGDGKLWLIPGAGPVGSDTVTGFGAPVNIGLGGWNVFSQLFSAGDLDGDGIPDLTGITPGGTMVFYAGRGDGQLRPGRQVGWGWQVMPTVIGVN